MKKYLVSSLVLIFLLSGCGGESDDSHAFIVAPNGNHFSLMNPDYSYLDRLHVGASHLYAIDVRPGFQYTVYLEPTAGDSDLYLYYDYTLSGQSLLAYSDFAGIDTDSVSFYADFGGVVYIEVFGVEDSRYFISYSEWRV